MRGIQFSKYSIYSILFVTTLSLFLSGCLVESSDPLPIVDRTTENLRPIQSGDQIIYRLTGQRSINSAFTPLTGRMTVTWTQDFIEDPHNPPSTINVLREETLVEYDDGFVSTTIRYVTQDVDGSLYVHAYRNKNIIVYAGDYTPSQVQFTYQPVQTVASPLTAANSTFSYRALDGCAATACSFSLRQITEANEYRDDVPVTTDAGKRYQSLYYTYTGFFLEDNSTPLINPLDFRTSCASVPIELSGEYYYFPEVGLVRFLSSCTGFDDSSGNTLGHRITGSLLSANFTLP